MLLESENSCPIAFDRSFGGPVCGMDEVGRGPLAGPVVAACAMVRPDYADDALWKAVTDSKKLTAKRREAMFEALCAQSYFAVAEVSAAEIDSLNIHQATLLAMRRAYEGMLAQLPASILPKAALVDGKFVPQGLSCAGEAVVKGDSRSLSIGIASIIAKVTRDRLMAQLHEAHPHYGWAKNSGYGTAEHLNGLKHFGMTQHHRKSFAPCKHMIETASATAA